MTIKGLLFDKDGTLFHYQGTWEVWCDLVLDDLSKGDAGLKDALAQAVGFDLANKSFVPGSAVVNASAAEINTIWADMLPEMGFEDVDRVAVKHLANIPNLPVCDLAALFGGLKEAGYTLGIATNDYEVGARMQLEAEGIDGFFDFICGFDSGYGSKPGPGMVEGFAKARGLSTNEVAMVGDSTHDLGAGRAAKAGLTVGVLTGPAGREDIAHLADVVLEDISELPEYLAGLG